MSEAQASGPEAAGATGGAAAQGARIAWGAFTDRRLGNAFKDKVRAISVRLGCDPSDLMAVIAFETGERFAPDVVNPVSGATGLIQFMPRTAESLGTSIGALSAMTAIEQLDWVERYIAGIAAGRPLGALGDLYMTVLWPKAVGEPESFVLFSDPSREYRNNKGLDGNRDGVITKAEATAKVVQKLVKGLKEGMVG